MYGFRGRSSYYKYSDLYILNSDGVEERITDGLGAKKPASSTDGKIIYFESAKNGNKSIYKLNRKTSKLTELLKGTENRIYGSPSLSSNEKYLAIKKSRIRPKIRDKKVMPVTILLDFKKDLSINNRNRFIPQPGHA